MLGRTGQLTRARLRDLLQELRQLIRNDGVQVAPIVVLPSVGAGWYYYELVQRPGKAPLAVLVTVAPPARLAEYRELALDFIATHGAVSGLDLQDYVSLQDLKEDGEWTDARRRAVVAAMDSYLEAAAVSGEQLQEVKLR